MKTEKIHRMLSCTIGAILCFIALNSGMRIAHSGGVINILWTEKEEAKLQKDSEKAEKYDRLISYYLSTHERLTSGLFNASAALGFCGLWLVIHGTRGLLPKAKKED